MSRANQYLSGSGGGGYGPPSSARGSGSGSDGDMYSPQQRGGGAGGGYPPQVSARGGQPPSSARVNQQYLAGPGGGYRPQVSARGPLPPPSARGNHLQGGSGPQLSSRSRSNPDRPGSHDEPGGEDGLGGGPGVRYGAITPRSMRNRQRAAAYGSDTERALHGDAPRHSARGGPPAGALDGPTPRMYGAGPTPRVGGGGQGAGGPTPRMAGAGGPGGYLGATPRVGGGAGGAYPGATPRVGGGGAYPGATPRVGGGGAYPGATPRVGGPFLSPGRRENSDSGGGGGGPMMSSRKSPSGDASQRSYGGGGAADPYSQQRWDLGAMSGGRFGPQATGRQSPRAAASKPTDLAQMEVTGFGNFGMTTAKVAQKTATYNPPYSRDDFKAWKGVNHWTMPTMLAVCESPFFCLSACLLPCVCVFRQRKALLNNRMIDYECCAGTCGRYHTDGCNKFSRGNEEFCLGVETLMCLGCAIHGNRWMIMQYYNLENDPTDSCVMFLSYLLIPCSYVMQDDAIEGIASALYMPCAACTITQVSHHVKRFGFGGFKPQEMQ